MSEFKVAFELMMGNIKARLQPPTSMGGGFCLVNIMTGVKILYLSEERARALRDWLNIHFTEQDDERTSFGMRIQEFTSNTPRDGEKED